MNKEQQMLEDIRMLREALDLIATDFCMGEEHRAISAGGVSAIAKEALSKTDKYEVK